MTFVIIENGRQHRKFKWAAENLGMEWTGRLPQNPKWPLFAVISIGGSHWRLEHELVGVSNIISVDDWLDMKATGAEEDTPCCEYESLKNDLWYI